MFKRKPEYYVEVVRLWESHSYDSQKRCLTYSHPMFLIKKRNLFKKDTVVKTFPYTNRIEDALDYVRHLNGRDFIDNERAMWTYGITTMWDNLHNSGTYIGR